MEDARAHYEEALKIDRQLAQQSPDVHLPQLAMTLSNFALFDAYQKNLDDARLHYQEALGIDRELIKQNSSVYLPDLAMTLSNLGRVDRMQGRNEESRGHYQEALGILQVLAESGPQYATEMARVQADLAQLKPGSPH
jgi:tetratricopeptide (TPR) repeat protein